MKAEGNRFPEIILGWTTAGMNFVLTLALTCILSPPPSPFAPARSRRSTAKTDRRGFYPSRFLVIRSPIRPIQSREFPSRRRTILLLLGERDSNRASTVGAKSLWFVKSKIPKLRSGATSSDYAAPTELANLFVYVLQICRADGAGFADERPANPVTGFSKGRRTIPFLRRNMTWPGCMPPVPPSVTPANLGPIRL